MYDSPVPAPFIRAGFQLMEDDVKENPTSGFPTSRASDDPTPETILFDEESFTITLTEEKQPQSTGVVHMGYLSCGTKCSRAPSKWRGIAVKIGFDHDEKSVLRSEYEIYQRLHKNGVKGIPAAIGLFEEQDRYGDDPFGGPYALVLSNAGHHLDDRAHTLPREAK